MPAENKDPRIRYRGSFLFERFGRGSHHATVFHTREDICRMISAMSRCSISTLRIPRYETICARSPYIPIEISVDYFDSGSGRRSMPNHPRHAQARIVHPYLPRAFDRHPLLRRDDRSPHRTSEDPRHPKKYLLRPPGLAREVSCQNPLRTARSTGPGVRRRR